MRLFLDTSVLPMLKLGVFLERERAAGRLKQSSFALARQPSPPDHPNAAASVGNESGKV